jgi:hypothetical protein
LRLVGFQMLTPSDDILFADWWVNNRKRVHKKSRKGFDSFVCLVSWMLWKERDARVFDRKSLQVGQLLQVVRDEGRQWILIGYRSLSDFFT